MLRKFLTEEEKAELDEECRQYSAWRRCVKVDDDDIFYGMNDRNESVINRKESVINRKESVTDRKESVTDVRTRVRGENSNEAEIKKKTLSPRGSKAAGTATQGESAAGNETVVASKAGEDSKGKHLIKKSTTSKHSTPKPEKIPQDTGGDVNSNAACDENDARPVK